MRLKPLEIAGILALGYFLVARVATQFQEGLNFGKIKAKLGKITPTGINILFKIPITNTSNISMPLDWFRGNLVYGQYVMAQLNITQPVTVEANSTIEVPLTAFVNFSDTAGNVATLITSGEWLNSFSVKGQASSKGLRFDVNEPLQIL